MNIVSTVKDFVANFKEHWTTPAKGRYMSYKEITSLSVGGIGIKFIVYCVSKMILAVGNTLIGNTIGIDPKPLYIIYLLSVLSNFPLTALRAKMIDNTRSMKGKYRPYIIKMGIPTVILGIGFIWMPYENMTLTQKCIVVLLFNIGFQFFYNFMTDASESIVNVLSPNTIERSDVCSIRSVVENIAPSIADIFLPIAARLITGENTLYDLKVYRYLYPPMLLVGLLVSIVMYVNTEEKIVQAKTHVVQIKFSDAFRAVARNKYFWIVSLAGWLGFLESAFGNILSWMYNYQCACSAAQYSVIVAIAGNASFWPNLVAPYFIRRYGKRKILLFTNILNIFFIAMMLPIVRLTGSASMIWIMLLCQFVNQFFTSTSYLIGYSLNADMRDYQQYITGERIDGMFAAVGLIGNVITLASSFVLPEIYERAGLNQTVALSLGYDGSNVYDVLYNREYFISICSVLIVASIVGAVMNVIPYFFYDLTETKQRAMVSVLKIRALFEDYGNGQLSEDSLTETMDIISDAENHVNKTPITIKDDKVKEAKKTKDRQQIKEAKKEIRELRAENEKIEIAQYVMGEINRYNTPAGKRDIEYAENIVNAGINGFADKLSISLKDAKAMKKTTQEEKQIRSDAIANVRKNRTALKTIKKYYRDGIEEFDMTVLDALFDSEDKNALAIHETIANLKKARENKDRAKSGQLKKELSDLHKVKSEIDREIKKNEHIYSVYNRASKPYLDAKKTLIQKENYSHYKEIAAEYEKSKNHMIELSSQ